MRVKCFHRGILLNIWTEQTSETYSQQNPNSLVGPRYRSLISESISAVAKNDKDIYFKSYYLQCRLSLNYQGLVYTTQVFSAFFAF